MCILIMQNNNCTQTNVNGYMNVICAIVPTYFM